MILSLIVLLNLSIIAIAFGEVFLLKENSFISFSLNKLSAFLLINSEPASKEIEVTGDVFDNSGGTDPPVPAFRSFKKS